MPKIKKIKYTMMEADRLFSELIRKPGKCYLCSSTFHLQCAHIISRGYKAVRYNPENALCLCQKCHFFYTYKPIEWEDLIKQKLPGRWEKLRKLALDYQKPDYRAIIEGLIGQIELIV